MEMKLPSKFVCVLVSDIKEMSETARINNLLSETNPKMSSTIRHESKISTLVLSSKDLEKKSLKRQKEIEKKKKEFLQTGDQILTYTTKISKISDQLKQQRSDEKDNRVSATRVLSHTNKLSLDRTKRPSDREFEIRNYSSTDMYTWKHDQVREWYNSYATDETPYRYVPSETGYTIKIE